jgi:hypothetical protein
MSHSDMETSSSVMNKHMKETWQEWKKCYEVFRNQDQLCMIEIPGCSMKSTSLWGWTWESESNQQPLVYQFASSYPMMTALCSPDSTDFTGFSISKIWSEDTPTGFIKIARHLHQLMFASWKNRSWRHDILQDMLLDLHQKMGETLTPGCPETLRMRFIGP